MSQIILNEHTLHPLTTETRPSSLWKSIRTPLIIAVILFYCIIFIFSFHLESITNTLSGRDLLMFNAFHKIKDKVQQATGTDYVSLEIANWERQNMRPIESIHVPGKEDLQKEIDQQGNNVRDTFHPEKFKEKLKSISNLIPKPIQRFIGRTLFQVLVKAARVVLAVLTNNFDPEIFQGTLTTLQEIWPPDGISVETPELDIGMTKKLIQNAFQALKDQTVGIYHAWQNNQPHVFADRVLGMTLYIFGAITLIAPPSAPVTAAFIITISGVRAAFKIIPIFMDKLSSDKYHKVIQSISGLTNTKFRSTWLPCAALDNEILFGHFTSLGEQVFVEFFGQQLDIQGVLNKWNLHLSVCNQQLIISLTNMGIQIVGKGSMSELILFIEIDNEEDRNLWIASLETQNRIECKPRPVIRAPPHQRGAE